MTDDHPLHVPRLTAPDRETLDEAGRRIYDELADRDGRYLKGINGPAGARLHSVPLSVVAQRVVDYLRFGSSISPWMREVAILTAAREMNNGYEWAAHEPEARRVAVDTATIDVVKQRRATDGISEPAAAIIMIGREGIGLHSVSARTYARALEAFGPQLLVELVSLMGQYMGSTLLINVFDYQPGPDDPTLPAIGAD